MMGASFEPYSWTASSRNMTGTQSSLTYWFSLRINTYVVFEMEDSAQASLAHNMAVFNKYAFPDSNKVISQLGSFLTPIQLGGLHCYFRRQNLFLQHMKVDVVDVVAARITYCLISDMKRPHALNNALSFLHASSQATSSSSRIAFNQDGSGCFLAA
ncbi:hypothetical protein Tco_0553811 [Tanacetum coccineum]